MQPDDHSISPEDLARVIASVYEPDLDWAAPNEYDLLDREELTGSAQKLLERLTHLGYSIERLEDLALNEFK